MPNRYVWRFGDMRNPKNKGMRLIILPTFLLALVCCRGPIIRGKFIATENFRQFEIKEKKKVHGEYCWRRILMFIPLGIGEDIPIEAAYREAMHAAPYGTDGLADVEIHYDNLYIPFLYASRCFRLSGYPAARTD